MKLVTYDRGDGPRAGVVVDERVLDAATLLARGGDCAMSVPCSKCRMIR
jgi:hypothetical protein